MLKNNWVEAKRSGGEDAEEREDTGYEDKWKDVQKMKKNNT